MIAAAPQPAELPLAGGLRGATVRLHPLPGGEWRAPPAHLHQEEGRLGGLRALGLGVPEDELVAVPLGSFLVEHPGAGPVLVDAGMHPSVAVDPRANLGRLAARMMRGLEVDVSQTAPAQLRARGVETGDVAVVVMTHLHLDHASAASEFPNATFVFDRREWPAATVWNSGLKGYARGQLDHALDWRTVDFDGPEADSFAAFGRALDLFGDGSVRCVHTPGHSPGHLSVILRLRNREALLTGDAAYTMRTVRDSRFPAYCEDRHEFRRSLREIQLYLEQTPSALVVPGHDAAVWRSLDAVYD